MVVSGFAKNRCLNKRLRREKVSGGFENVKRRSDI